MQSMQGKHLRLIGAFDSGAAGWYISPNGFDLYRTGAGDTLGVLANRYLGSASRAGEIWALQSSAWRAARNDDMNNVERGAQLIMPQEAIDKAKAMGQIAEGGKGQPPTKFTSGKVLEGGTDVLKPSAPVPVPVRPATPTPLPSTPASIVKVATGPSLTTIALGALGVVVAGGAIAYGVHRFGSRRKHNPARRRGRRARRANPEPERLPLGEYRGCLMSWGGKDPGSDYGWAYYTTPEGFEYKCPIRVSNAKSARDIARFSIDRYLESPRA